MKASKIIAALLASAVSVMSLSALAQTATPKIDKRQETQEQRINNGVANGSLTATEAAKLDRQEAKIEAREQAAKADGVVTKAERAKLHAAQERTSAKIYRKKHNARSSN
ncbi:hypothetical protein RF679_13160 [Undibacterium cyanobacteriorum]|uniref:DUF4148 domain-containing protein n=1 Tax=Undibacterium cyanobacteriorum TaxID=3073561 RepID=A0ABY9REE5_9BURK|nr:hypothetical protein [Undibacterium sp. 20NA77.5]WMW79595.1 hypothetical protein RF679_13160 [Undibacterium sp. 20NA77.5]